MNVLTGPTIATTGLTVPIPKPVSLVNAYQERKNSFVSLVNDNEPIGDQIEFLPKVPKEMVLNVFKKTNVSLEKTHATLLLPVLMSTSHLNALVLPDTKVMVLHLPMAVAGVSILMNVTKAVQIAQIIQLARTAMEAMNVIVMLVTRNLQMEITCARMSMNVLVMMFSNMIA